MQGWAPHRRLPWAQAGAVLVLALLPSTAAAAVPVQIAVRVAGHHAPGTIPVLLSLEQRESAEGVPEPIRAHLEAPGQIAVDLPRGGLWELRAEAPGYWAPSSLVVVEDGEVSPTSVTIFPTGTLSGKLVLPRETPAPAHLSVRFGPAPVTPEAEGVTSPSTPAPTGTRACLIEGEVWRCEVPAGFLDLRLRTADDFAPVYLWGVALDPGEERDLGGVAFQHGASVAGWVEGAADGRPIDGARVSLTPATSALPGDPATLERLRASSLQASTNLRGFFQLRGVSAGTYRVTVEHPGLAPAEMFPIEVLPGLESEISEPIALAAPGTLQIAVEPAADPYGRSWEIRLFPFAGSHGRPTASVAMDPSDGGEWSRSGLAPGPYRLVLFDAEDGVWVNEEIRVLSGEQRHFVSVPVLEIRGTAAMGGEPVTGVLWLGTRDGTRRCRFAVDLEGKFEGFLPGEGLWPAEILIEEEELRLSLDPVTVERKPGESHARVEIEIPDTRLAGEVVDGGGRAVAGAHVLVHAGDGERPPSRRTSDGDGRFLFRGLPEGQVTVVARRGEETSDWVPVSLDEELEPPELRLTLRSNRTITGRTVTAAGPLAGAELVLWPRLTAPGGGRIVQAVSGPDGTFRAEVPADAFGVTLIARAPTYAARLLAIPLSEHDDQPIEVALDGLGGTLVIELGDATGLDGSTPLLAHGHAFALLPLLTRILKPERELEGAGHRLVFQPMEVGNYSICLGGAAVAAMMEGRMAPGGGCASGFLPPMGELVLRAPTSPPAPP